MTVTKHRVSTSVSSPAPSDQPRTDTDGVEVEDFGLEFDPPSPSTNAASTNSPMPPSANVAELASESVGWHLSFNDGRQEGPLHTEVIRHRLAFGSLSSETLIWRSGMPKWEPVNSVPEFRNPSSVQPPPTFTDSIAWQAPIDRIDWTGWANALLTASLGLWGVSCLGGYWGFSWFTGGLLLFLGYLTCHGFAQVIERLSRIEARLSSPSGGDKQHD